jgi:glycosyltransferase involved in cell wall biosynthesis
MINVGIDARELQGSPTGVGRYLRNLVREWTRATGDRFHLYFNGAAPVDSLLDLPAIVKRPLGPGGLRGIWWQERLVPPAARADAVDVFFSPAYVCPLRLRTPRVTTVHDMSFFALPRDFTVRDGFRRRLLVAASVRASRSVLAVSDFTRREILARFPEAEAKTVLVPLGADEDLPPAPGREEARARLGVTGPLLLAVGAIFNRRCLPDLLRAVARLRSRWPDLRLDVVGEDRTYPPLDILGLVRGLGLEPHVRLSGFVGDAALATRYAAADVAVVISEYEGFGLPVLEAMSRGVPVVTSTAPALGELFAEAAVLVDPHDVPDIAAAVSRVLGEPELRERLQERGRALAARYSWAETARRTREVLAAAARP